MMKIIRPPQVLRSIYRDALWRMDKSKPELFLTFDDGPVPGVTEWVLGILETFKVKATFFCVGENIAKHPALFEKILADGHQVGNHTYNHIKGWKTSNKEYFGNIGKCQALTQTPLFRAPYGRIKKSQYKFLKRDFRIVFWDVISYDYDKLVSPETCLQNVINYTRNGSIIVFHDTAKSEGNLRFALPAYIENCLKLNYTFATL
jgi:peptidoglycan-N-acetylglucosamine deacetylase